MPAGPSHDQDTNILDRGVHFFCVCLCACGGFFFPFSFLVVETPLFSLGDYHPHFCLTDRVEDVGYFHCLRVWMSVSDTPLFFFLALAFTLTLSILTLLIHSFKKSFDLLTSPRVQNLLERVRPWALRSLLCQQIPGVFLCWPTLVGKGKQEANTPVFLQRENQRNCEAGTIWLQLTYLCYV